jgi:hypothetical protein
MSGPVIVSGVRAPRVPAERPAKLPQPLQRGAWPFPSSDPGERYAMAIAHQAQQRAAVVNGPEALL